MSRRIKLIWDFWGPRAQGTAEHQRSHIDEFSRREAVTAFGSGVEAGEAGHWMAWLVVEEGEVDKVRLALKPGRGLEA
jgi:hypothetical protein